MKLFVTNFLVIEYFKSGSFKRVNAIGILLFGKISADLMVFLPFLLCSLP